MALSVWSPWVWPAAGIVVVMALYGLGYVHGRGHRTISALFSSEAAEKEIFRQLVNETEDENRRLGREVDRLRRCMKLTDGLLSSGQAANAQAQLRVGILSGRVSARSAP